MTRRKRPPLTIFSLTRRQIVSDVQSREGNKKRPFVRSDIGEQSIEKRSYSMQECHCVALKREREKN